MASTEGRVLSVNVGRPRTFEFNGRQVRSAIWKSPVVGRVAARGMNLDGDDQADRKAHGGVDKAIYAYAIEDLRWWESELGRSLPVGQFGENLTTEGIDVNGALVGERWEVGTTLLEVAEPRVPWLAARCPDGRYGLRPTLHRGVTSRSVSANPFRGFGGRRRRDPGGRTSEPGPERPRCVSHLLPRSPGGRATARGAGDVRELEGMGSGAAAKRGKRYYACSRSWMLLVESRGSVCCPSPERTAAPE